MSLPKSYIFISCLVFALLQMNPSEAVTITTIATGNWNANGTWSLGRKPTCGDTVVISSGKTVTVTAQDNLVPCGTPLMIYVSGTWQFTNGNKVDLPCGSWVYLLSGGVVKKSTAGGGNSTLISICGYVEWNAGDGQITGPDTLGGHGTLPVTWLTFQASFKEKMVEVNWSTAVEINNDYFDLMRSADGVNYTSIGRINGNGNSTEVNYYSFLDVEPEPGISYYRLIQVDYDGRQNPSDVIAVFNASGGMDISDIRLSPNPVTTDARVVFNSRIASEAQLEVKNANGQICLTQRISAQKGINTVLLDKVGILSKGIYTLTVSTVTGASRPFGLIKK